MSNKQVVRRWFDEVWNKRDGSAISRMFAPERIARGLADSGQDLVGPERFLAFHQAFMDAFADLHITIDDLLEEDDRVAARWHCTGTLTGYGLGVPPTGKRMTMTGMSIARVQNGQIVEAWNTVDFLGMHRQLGTLAAVAAK